MRNDTKYVFALRNGNVSLKFMCSSTCGLHDILLIRELHPDRRPVICCGVHANTVCRIISKSVQNLCL